ncbi:MAG: tryptophan--tRNA ligase [Anaerovoracaceae bacterium]|nr:tryptophan--tRNA ligase [Anaerovoracaceae bacterium]
MDKIMLTGDRPTGKLHLGHYVGSLRQRLALQGSPEYKKIFVLLADAQALTDNADNPEKVRQNIVEVMLDYLAVGLDPERTTIFIQSQIQEMYEMTSIFMNLVTVSRLERNPTIKSEIQMRGFEASVPVGFLCYPVSQTTDIVAFKATTVPVGEDQEPMLEQAREIVRKFNSTYGPVLVEPEILLPEKEECNRLPGIDGQAKMSKSLGNGIYLSDDADTVAEKVKIMYTDPKHLRVEDPGHVEGNTVFTYLDAFATQEQIERLSEFESLDDMKARYEHGGLGDVACKKVLTEVLNELLEPIRTRRHEYEKDIPYVYETLKKGTDKAREEVAKTLHEMKDAMKINYFEDSALIKEQMEKYHNI